MFHVLKKQVARAQQPLSSKGAPNAEFADLRQRLCSIKTSLKYTSQMLSSANRTWIKLMQEQRHFSERFHESYPTTTGETYTVAEAFALGSQNLYDKFTRHSDANISAYNDIHRQVLLYIKEIETVEASYPKLAEAKSEANRYQVKLDAMERSKKPADQSKKQRNLQKMDAEKELYKRLLKVTVDQQKKVYAKHPVVFKAALTSYWLSHEKHVNLLVESLEETQQFAQQHEQEMRQLDITSYQPQDPLGFTALPAPIPDGLAKKSSSMTSSSPSSSVKAKDSAEEKNPAESSTANSVEDKAVQLSIPEHPQPWPAPAQNNVTFLTDTSALSPTQVQDTFVDATSTPLVKKPSIVSESRPGTTATATSNQITA